MTAWLVALTEEARRALHGEQRVLDRLPFKVGRESRSAARRAAPTVDRRRGAVAQLNDLYILEDGEVVNVSREHFLIERDGDGYVLVDRASAGGTLVEGRRVGGDRAGGRAELHDHDVIIVGTSHSPFIFKFRAE
jgi:pSer/pThr/pTyr-binding forkhead associated (FHA) protein